MAKVPPTPWNNAQTPRPYHRCRTTVMLTIVFVLVILMRSLHNELYGEYAPVTSRLGNSCRLILYAQLIEYDNRGREAYYNIIH